MSSPKRIRLSRRKGWRKPENVIVVARPTRWGNPYKVGLSLARYPALDGSEWEPEGRLKTLGMSVYMRADGTLTEHDVRVMTLEQCIESFRNDIVLRGHIGNRRGTSLSDIVTALRGHDLACWCPTPSSGGQPAPCHADVLLELANREDISEPHS